MGELQKEASRANIPNPPASLSSKGLSYVTGDKDQYFDLLESTLEENNLFDVPSSICNCDETGIPLGHKPQKGICKKGLKQFSKVTQGDKTQITVLAAVSAAGYALPPFVIFTGKYLRNDLTHGEVPGT